MSAAARWQSMRLDECFWFQEGPGVRKWQFRDAGIKLLNVANIEKSGRLNLEKTDRYLDQSEVSERYSHFLIDEGDLVIASSGISFDEDGLLRTRGAFVSKEHLPLCLNTSTIRFKSKEGLSDSSYLKHWLDSHAFRKQITKLVTGSAQQNFGPSHLKAIKIDLPPLPEQRRIAAILDKADALRTKRREALAQLDRLAQSIFVEMFGDPTRPESTGTRPTSKVQLGNFVKIQTGKLDANAAVEGGSYPFFTCAVKSLEIDIAAFDCKAVLVAGNGDLNVKYYEGKFNAYQRTYVIQSKDEHRLLSKFLYQFLDLYVAELRKQAIGGVIKYIKLPYLTEAPLNIPALEFQSEFVGRFDAISFERKKLAEALALSEKLFLSVQLRAFRGEL